MQNKNTVAADTFRSLLGDKFVCVMGVEYREHPFLKDHGVLFGRVVTTETQLDFQLPVTPAPAAVPVPALQSRLRRK